MIHISDKHFVILQSILEQTSVQFYAFGSRIEGTHNKFSDLDLCFMEEIQESTLYKIKEDLIESSLPFKVDIVDFNECSKEFQELINADMVPLVPEKHSPLSC